MPPTAPPAPKRRPTVLVTDARSAAPPQQAPSRVRFVSVDSVLRGTSEIPSGQRRAPVDPRRAVDQSRVLPSRSSKVSEKLVFLPETTDEEARWDYQDAEDEPLRDYEGDEDDQVLEDDDRTSQLPPRKSYAERLPKSRRAEKFSRVTAYCTADGYRLKLTSQFLREHHAARTKLYDECLYVAYHLPLLRGEGGYRLQSSPALKNPGGKPVLDMEIERSERRNYHEGYFEDCRERRFSDEGRSEGEGDHEHNGSTLKPEEIRPESPKDADGIQRMDMNNVGEMFLFSYGVVVFWNLSERQEKDILGDLIFVGERGHANLIIGPMKEEDFESEEFNFEYSPKIRSPRIYNDMITLRSGDIMVKLAISHAIAQSTKLCGFEERMSRTMSSVDHIPRKLALTGNLGMKREEVIKMSGRLFRLRVDVNLSSNVLDVPEFFWDEPALHPLYSAVREYLEIQPRVATLNSRCGVFLDLAEILTDSIADSNMSRITWIIIALIVLSILVTLAEVTIRFGILNSRKRAGGGGGGGAGGGEL